MTVGDERAVDLLEAMLQVPSLTGREDRLASLLLREMAVLGFAVGRDDAGNVIGTIPGAGRSASARTIVVLGHMDTVPGAIAVERRDGALYGRGAVDAKGPLACGIVAAARAAARSGACIRVIGAVQEEGPSMGARHLAASPAPDMLIIAEPSDWDAIVLGYKGSQRFSVEIVSPCGHSAGPQVTACEQAFDFWRRLIEWCEGFGHAASNGEFSRLTPTLLGMTSSSDGLHDHAYLQIGLRLPPAVALTEIQSGVRALLPDGLFSFRAGEPAVKSEKSGPLVAGFLRAIRVEGGRPRFKVKTGTSDMNVVGPVWRCPMLAYGPGDSSLDHTPDEHIVLDEYLRAIRVLTRVLEEL